MFKTLIEKNQFRKMNSRLDCDFYKRELSISKAENRMLEMSILYFVTNWSDFKEPFSILIFSLVGKRQFYDSTWGILYQHHGVIGKIEIVRDDTQRYADLDQCLGQCGSIADIEKLDRQSIIYYD